MIASNRTGAPVNDMTAAGKVRTIETRPLKPRSAVEVPGSKSYTHRTFIAAALSGGVCRVTNALRSEDTLLTLEALRRMGVEIHDDGLTFVIRGMDGSLRPCSEPLYLGNSGTSMRLLAGVVILGRGSYTLTGSPRMCERPIQPLLEALGKLNVESRSVHSNGCPPVTIAAGGCRGGRTQIDCGVSSQYLSGLLLSAPCLEQGLVVDVTNGPVSKPYVDMTVDIMNAFGVRLTRRGYEHFEVPGGQSYCAGDYAVEPDVSQAGYFWAAAAVTGAAVKVLGISPGSRQGDLGLARIFQQMGCEVDEDGDGICVTGGDLTAVSVDMGDMPDMVPTLAVVAAFARGTTVMRHVAHLRAKESDRLAAVARELGRMGIETAVGPDELRVVGGTPHAAAVETYDDHRMAMCFSLIAIAGVPIRINDPKCVNKTFPGYWDAFNSICQ